MPGPGIGHIVSPIAAANQSAAACDSEADAAEAMGDTLRAACERECARKFRVFASMLERASAAQFQGQGDDDEITERACQTCGQSIPAKHAVRGEG